MSAFFICAGCSQQIPDDQDATHWCPKRIEIARKPIANAIVDLAMAAWRARNGATDARTIHIASGVRDDLWDTCAALAEFEMKHGARA